MEFVFVVAAGYVLALVTWLFYLAATNLIRIRKQLTGFAMVNGYILVTIGLILDTLLNVFVGTLIFLELPKEFLFTPRLQRQKKSSSKWRAATANWICANLLNPFDPDHC